METPPKQNPQSDSPPFSDSEQRELEELANDICDTEFEQLWTQVEEETKGLSHRDLAEEFFYQGVLSILAIQKMEEKEIEEQDARRFQFE